jgi:amino acid transporter
VSDEPGKAAAGGSIGLVACLAFAVGTMVGGGVFTLSGVAIDMAGPSAIVSYLIAGLVMLLSALSFVTIATRAAPGDSGYGPIGTILGPAWRFLVMWGFYVNGATILTFLLLSFGDYLNEFFLAGLGATAAALIATLAISALNLGPADLVAKAETWVVGLKIGILVFFIVWGISEIGNAQFEPFAPGGEQGIREASALLFTAYTGFNVVTNMAGAVRNPRRTVPLAVIGSVLISGVIYIGVILAMLASGVEDFGSTGVGEAATALMGEWGGYLIAFAACISTLSGANANLLGASEVMIRLVGQGDAPPVLARTTRSGHPLLSVLLIGALTLVLVLVARVDNIVTYANVAALVAMVVVNVAAFQLARKGWPGEGLRLPGGPVIPAIATVACLGQFVALDWPQALIGLGLVAAGLLIYRSRHRQEFGDGAELRAREAVDELDTPLLRAARSAEYPLGR